MCFACLLQDTAHARVHAIPQMPSHYSSIVGSISHLFVCANICCITPSQQRVQDTVAYEEKGVRESDERREEAVRRRGGQGEGGREGEGGGVDRVTYLLRGNLCTHSHTNTHTHTLTCMYVETPLPELQFELPRSSKR